MLKSTNLVSNTCQNYIYIVGFKKNIHYFLITGSTSNTKFSEPSV
jgi:hypothetical protein